MSSQPEFLTTLLVIVTAGIGFASLFGYLGRTYWRFDLFSHFRVQIALLAGLCTLGFLLVGELTGVIISLLICIDNLRMILPLYRRMDPKPPSTANIRLLSANLLGSNRDYQAIVNMLQDTHPDLALLVEYDHHHHQQRQAITHGFPFTHFIPQDDNYGLALLSQLPLLAAETLYLNADRVPVIMAHLELDGHPLTVIGCHPPPPKTQAMTTKRDRLLHALADLASSQPGHVILLGDMNTTSWSYAFRDLLRHSRLHDSRRGFGVRPTWPTHFPLLLVPIDHLLHSRGLHVTFHQTIALSGSDHRALLVDLSLADEAHP